MIVDPAPLAPPATTFDPGAVRQFRFIGHGLERRGEDLVLLLSYALDRLVLTETVTMPAAPPLTAVREEALLRLVRHLHLAAGVSYYKAAAPPLLVVETGGLDAGERAFYADLYLHGLGEYAFVNGLDLAERLHWQVDDAPAPAPLTGLALPARPLVPVGGGKDSSVSIEMLRHRDPLLFSIGAHQAIADVTAAAGLPHQRVTRRLDPVLFDLNAAGALNGHVPVTAVVSLIALCAAVVYGADTVVMSNERSASVGNREWAGREVNHQWSKGLDLERGLASLLARTVSAELRYASLLRPLSELHIARLFASLERYHPVFTSCNRAFTLLPEGRVARWCGDCPKCRFVSLALAPFVGPDVITEIVGANLLDDPAQEHGFLALLGIGDYKPFECVGEVGESAVAVRMLAEQPRWASATLVPRLTAALRAQGWPTDADVVHVFTPSTEHALDEDLLEVVRAAG